MADNGATQLGRMKLYTKAHSRLFLPVDGLENGWAGQLEHGCWQACSCMLEQTVHWWLDERTDRGTMSMYDRTCYSGTGNDEITRNNNHELGLGCYIKSGFACSINIREQPLSIRQAVYNMSVKHDWTIHYYYFTNHVNSVVTGLLSQQPCK